MGMRAACSQANSRNAKAENAIREFLDRSRCEYTQGNAAPRVSNSWAAGNEARRHLRAWASAASGGYMHGTRYVSEGYPARVRRLALALIVVVLAVGEMGLGEAQDAPTVNPNASTAASADSG